jgi:hypothetical protein
MFSVVMDFLIKIQAKNFLRGAIPSIPVPPKNHRSIINRVLRLSCLTSHYADLWQTAFTPAMRQDAFAWNPELLQALDPEGLTTENTEDYREKQSTSPLWPSVSSVVENKSPNEATKAQNPATENTENHRADQSAPPQWPSVLSVVNNQSDLDWSQLTDTWQRGCALRNDLARRQALLEIDVLVAQALGLTLDELIQIYRVQFPVMKGYEEADQYDAQGRRLPNTARKDPGTKELREALKDHDGHSPVTITWEIDNGNAIANKTFHPPFTHVDRIQDYRVAWAAFQGQEAS